ncbi:unnamed protein product [Gadus morhua 'NCC']
MSSIRIQELLDSRTSESYGGWVQIQGPTSTRAFHSMWAAAGRQPMESGVQWPDRVLAQGGGAPEEKELGLVFGQEPSDLLNVAQGDSEAA